MPTNDGSAITRETEFDKFAVTIRNLSDVEPAQFAYLYSGDERIGRIQAEDLYRHRTFDESDPEVIEVQRRLDAGEATLHYLLPGSTELHALGRASSDILVSPNCISIPRTRNRSASFLPCACNGR